MIEPRRQELPRGVRIGEAALAQQTGDYRRHAQRRGGLTNAVFVGGHVFPSPRPHQVACSGAPGGAGGLAAETTPIRPMLRNFW